MSKIGNLMLAITEWYRQDAELKALQVQVIQEQLESQKPAEDLAPDKEDHLARFLSWKSQAERGGIDVAEIQAVEWAFHLIVLEKDHLLERWEEGN